MDSNSGSSVLIYYCRHWTQKSQKWRALQRPRKTGCRLSINRSPFPRSRRFHRSSWRASITQVVPSRHYNSIHESCKWVAGILHHLTSISYSDGHSGDLCVGSQLPQPRAVKSGFSLCIVYPRDSFAVFQRLLSEPSFPLRDAARGALAQIHELAAPPVRICGAVRLLLLAAVEKHPLPCWCKIWQCRCIAR